MALRLAILDENDRVYIEYSSELFKKLLVIYARDLPVEQAFEKLEHDLRMEAARR